MTDVSTALSETPDEGTTPAPCPRCQEETTSAVAFSPQPGRWTMYSCSTCWYAWRSTESGWAAGKEAYPADFRVNPADIPDAFRLV